jgi:hypothetical protein
MKLRSAATVAHTAAVEAPQRLVIDMHADRCRR